MIDLDTIQLEVETFDAEVGLDPLTVFVWAGVAISAFWLPFLVLWLAGVLR